MVHIAKIVTVAKYKNITDKLKPFVDFQSGLAKIEITDDGKIAVLQVEGTESYFPIFLQTKPTIEQVEEKLAKQDTKLNKDSKKLLIQYLDEEQ